MKNLIEIPQENMIASKTNIIQLKDDFDSNIERALMSFETTKIAIDAYMKVVPREKIAETATMESKDVYFKRVHKIIGNEILNRLELEDPQAHVKYELLPLPEKDSFLVFYINESSDIDSAEVEATLDYLLDISENLEDRTKNRILCSLLSLTVKASLYESCRNIKGIGAELFNTTLLLSPIVTMKKDKCFITALKPDFYLSDNNEFIYNLSTVNYEGSVDNEVGKELIADGLNCFITSNDKTVRINSRRRATSVKRKFYQYKKDFGQCKLLAFEYVHNAIVDRFHHLNVSSNLVTYAPTYEIDNFLALPRDFKESLYDIYVVDTANEMSKEIEDYKLFVERVANMTDAKGVLTLDEYEKLSKEATEPLAFVFAHAVENDDNSIEYFNDKLLEKLKQKGKENSFPAFATTFQAYDRKLKDKKNNEESHFDYYSELKIKLLEDNLYGTTTKKKHIYQGLNITSKNVKELKANLAIVGELGTGKKLTDKEEKKLNTAVKFLTKDSKAEKILVELRLKQLIYSDGAMKIDALAGGGLTNGHYFANYIKHTKDQDNDEFYHSKVHFALKDGTITVLRQKCERVNRDLLIESSPYLAFVPKLFNDSYFIHNLETRETITSYSSIRTPLALSNAEIDLVQMWNNCSEDSDYAVFGKKSGGKNKTHENILPAYFRSSRSTKDPVGLEHMKYHHVYLSENDGGCLVNISNAQAPSSGGIDKQIISKQVYCWDLEGKPVEWKESSLFSQYLNSHTFNILNLNESSKTTLFTKLAELLLLN